MAIWLVCFVQDESPGVDGQQGNKLSPAYRIVWRGEATLGEGPVWDRRDGCLWFVDIKAQRVHRLDVESGESRSWPAPAQIGWILPTGSDAFLVGLQDGLYRFMPADGSFELVTAVENDQPGNRLNDATVGPDGTVWFGTMDDVMKRPSGFFYRWNGEAVEQLSIPPAIVTNGPAVSPDGRRLYVVDSVAGIVSLVPLGPDGPEGGSEEFVRIDPRDGHPDGVIVDSAGNVWLGLWGGSCARRYGPDGSLQQQVDLPATNITKVALGGPDLKTAFATSARADLDEATLAQEPDAGAVFAFDVDVAGQLYPPAVM